MKKIHLSMMISAIFICIPNLVLANCGGFLVSLENKDSYLNCRSGPGKKYEVLKKLPHGLPIFVKHQVYNNHNTPWIFLSEGCFVIDTRLTNNKLVEPYEPSGKNYPVSISYLNGKYGFGWNREKLWSCKNISKQDIEGFSCIKVNDKGSYAGRCGFYSCEKKNSKYIIFDTKTACNDEYETMQAHAH